MNLNNKNLYTRVSLWLLLGYFLTFLCYYFANYLFYDAAALSYLWVFVQKITYMLFPSIAALFAFIGYAYKGMKFTLVRIIPMSFARMIYSVPYYYLIFILDFYDSVESILFGTLCAFADVAVTYLITFIIFMLLTFISKKKSSEPLDRAVAEKTVLDFANPVSLSVMAVSLLSFVYLFVTEIIDTVEVISSYSGVLTFSDIAYMIFCYIFDVGMLILYYVILSYIKNKTVAKRVFD